MVFKIQGNKLYKNDKEYTVKGVNVQGYRHVWPDDICKQASLIIDTWKFNLVRPNCFLGKEPQWPQFDDNNDLDKIIRTFTNKEVIVMFDGHDHIGGYYTNSSNPSLSTLVNFYRNLATKYKDNPYVWFDIANEPGDTNLNKGLWLDTHRAVIKAIRETGNNNIILCEGAAWGQDVGEWSGNNVEEGRSAILTLGEQVKNFDGKIYNNIGFSIHIYDQWNYGDSKMRNYFDRVNSKGHYLLVGEYGNWNANQDTTKATASFFKLINEESTKYGHIGRVMWAWYGGDLNDLVRYPDGNTKGGWGVENYDKNKTPSNLSWVGKLTWADNQKPQPLTVGSTLDKVSNPIPTPIPTPIIPIPNLSDLIIVEISIQEAMWRKDSYIHFVAVVKNISDVATPFTWHGLSFEVNSKQVDWAGQEITIPGNGSITFISQGWQCSSSCFTLKAIIDDQNKIKETNEVNNSLEVIFN